MRQDMNTNRCLSTPVDDIHEMHLACLAKRRRLTELNLYVASAASRLIAYDAYTLGLFLSDVVYAYDFRGFSLSWL